MKIWKNKRFLLVIMALCLLLSSSVALAEDKEKKGATYIKPNEVTVGGVTRQSQTYETTQFELMTYVDEGILPSFDETVENWQGKLKSYAWNGYLAGVDFILIVVYNLFSFDVLDKLNDGIADVMKDMSSQFTGQLLTFFMALFAMSIVFRGLWKQDFSVMMSILTKGILVIALLYSISFKPDSYFNLFESITAGVENELLKVNPTLSSEGTFDVDDGFTSPKATGVLVENNVYQALKYKPYLRMQYGTSNESVINGAVNKDYGVIEGKRNRIANYLQASRYTEAGVKKREKITEAEYNVLKNTNIGANQTPSIIVKLWVYNFNALIQLLFYISLAIIRIGLQFCFIGMMVMLPLFLLLSLMPTYENLWLGYLRGILNICLYKALTVFFVLLSTSILSVGYEVAAKANDIYYETFITLMYVAGIVFVMLKRKFVFDILKDAHQSVTQRTSNMADKFHDVTKGATKGATKHAGNVAVATMSGGLGAGVVSGIGGRKLGRAYIEKKRRGEAKKEKEQRMAKRTDFQQRGEQEQQKDGESQQQKSGEVVPLEQKKKSNKVNAQPNGSIKKKVKCPKCGKLPCVCPNGASGATGDDPPNNGNYNQPLNPSDIAQRETAATKEAQQQIKTKQQTASTKEQAKHITKWEAQQQVNGKQQQSGNPKTANKAVKQVANESKNESTYEGTKRDRRSPKKEKSSYENYLQETAIPRLKMSEVSPKRDLEQESQQTTDEPKKERTSSPYRRPVFRTMKRADEE